MKKTQKNIVVEYIQDKEKVNIKEVSQATNILEPNIRRILGQGEKVGIFERLASGVYRIKNKDSEQLYLYNADSIDFLPRLVENGVLADTIFLDIPYDTPAVKGGNRGVKYELISVSQFKSLLFSCTRLLRNEDSKIIFMYSNAPSGLKKMKEYIDCFNMYNLSCIADGAYTKLWAGGKVATNMRGDEIRPEGIKIYSKSPCLLNMNFSYSLPRPNGYPTEKNEIMISDVLSKTTIKKGLVIDPFAGSGVVGIAALKLDFSVILIDKAQASIDYIVNRINSYIEKSSQLSLF